MARCTRARNLDVHHKRRGGGNTLDNAQVLCPQCHEATSTYGAPGPTPPPFLRETKEKALNRADNQCECISTRGCH